MTTEQQFAVVSRHVNDAVSKGRVGAHRRQVERSRWSRQRHEEADHRVRAVPGCRVITPWNGPLSTPLLDIPPALMAGCAVLSKPSEFAPLGWKAAVDGWKEIGAPEVLDAVNGFGETGACIGRCRGLCDVHRIGQTPADASLPRPRSA